MTITGPRTPLERLSSLRMHSNWAAPLLARITLGVLFMSTGWGKVHNLAKVTAFFMELGIPLPAFNAVVVSYVELLCGAMLLLGIATRLSALPLMASMAVALITAKRDEIHSLPDLFGLVEWTYWVLLFLVLCTGAGKVSIDAWIRRSTRHTSQAACPSLQRLNTALPR